MKKDIENLIISSTTTIQSALQKMSDGGEKMLLIVDDGRQLKGVLSDGNIRRFIIQTGGLEGVALDCYTPSPIIASPDTDDDVVKDLMLTHKIEVLPVVNSDGEVVGIQRWCDQFKDGGVPERAKIEAPVVIMAGGKGTRLDPFTRILPKPLIPIGDKPIIEVIVERFHEYGCKDFFISINHKAKLIKAFFEDLVEDYKLEYLEETKPLGTGGSLAMLKGKVSGPVFLSNCDILVDADYSDLLNFHVNQKFDITIVAAVKHVNVPYGVCHIAEGGNLESIVEKPTFDFLINTGMYVFSSEHLDLIQPDEHMDFPDLIERVRNKGGSVGVYPVEENAWLDVGQWEEYHRSLELFNK